MASIGNVRKYHTMTTKEQYDTLVERSVVAQKYWQTVPAPFSPTPSRLVRALWAKGFHRDARPPFSVEVSHRSSLRPWVNRGPRGDPVIAEARGPCQHSSLQWHLGQWSGVLNLQNACEWVSADCYCSEWVVAECYA